ncbi:MAG: copper amine oxidase N-terminal domain-containing protein [Clostridiales bacterium]|nr:copper amine oxidase N-terminal domain-containing protein [Clostridiales bacterium]
MIKHIVRTLCAVLVVAILTGFVPNTGLSASTLPDTPHQVVIIAEVSVQTNFVREQIPLGFEPSVWTFGVPNAEIAIRRDGVLVDTLFTDGYGEVSFQSPILGEYSIQLVNVEGYRFISEIIPAEGESRITTYLFMHRWYVVPVDPSVSLRQSFPEFTYVVREPSMVTFVSADNPTIATFAPPPEQPTESTDIRVSVDGVVLELDVPPIIVDGRTLGPFRAIGEALGAEVDWDNDNQIATLSKDGVSASMTIDSNVVTITESCGTQRHEEIDVPALIYDGRTLVPVRWFAEFFRADVEWDGDERMVIIFSPTPPLQ